MTDPPAFAFRELPGNAGPREQLLDAVTDRLDDGLDRLVAAIARVLADGARSDAALRSAEVDALRAELIAEIGRASAADAEALRSALADGFARVEQRMAVAIRAEVARVGGIASAPSPGREGEVGEGGEAPAPAPTQVDPASLLPVRQDLGTLSQQLNGVAQHLAQELAAVRAVVADQLPADLAGLSATVAASVAAGRQEVEDRAERLRTELVVSLGALEEAVRTPVESLRGPVHALLAPVEALRAPVDGLAAGQAAGFAALRREVADLAGAVAAIAAAQAELRSLVAGLWGIEGGEPPGPEAGRPAADGSP